MDPVIQADSTMLSREDHLHSSFSNILRGKPIVPVLMIPGLQACPKVEIFIQLEAGKLTGESFRKDGSLWSISVILLLRFCFAF